MNSGWRLKECGRRARKGSISTCQATGWAAVLHCVHGDTHPAAGTRGPISQCQLDESPAHPLKTIATVSKGVPRYGSTPLKRDLPGAREECSEPKSGRRRPRRHTRARVPPPGPAPRCTHQVKSLLRILLRWLPIVATEPSVWGSVTPALAGDSASMWSLRASRARNPEKCPGPEDRRRRL